MAGKDDPQLTDLKWEWPADRVPESRWVVRVDDFSNVSGGLLGVKKFPSIASSMPDPVRVQGAVLAADGQSTGRTVVLVLPRAEIPDVRVGDKITLGVTGTTCISAAKQTDR